MLHLRLWNIHIKRCKENKRSYQTLQLTENLRQGVTNALESPILYQLYELPDPEGFHSTDYTRFVVSYYSTCLGALLENKEFEVCVRKVLLDGFITLVS